MVLRRTALAVLVPALLASCLKTDNPVLQVKPTPTTSERGFPLGSLVISNDDEDLLTLGIEIAKTPQHRALGLMNVTELSDSEGMAFIFETTSSNGFWMKNTLIPLDIAFWDESNVIVKILQMEPCKADPCPTYSPGVEYVGALEVNKGLFDASGVAEGDKITLDDS